MKTSLNLVVDAMEGLREHHSARFPAFSTLQAFLEMRSRIQVEILAIDCVAPINARVKNYVRNRQTSWHSVQETVTLNGAIQHSELSRPLQDLELLWKMLFCIETSTANHTNLSNNSHRTAGILYNFELRPGVLGIVPKVYIPVRHYLDSDSVIVQRVGTFLHHRNSYRFFDSYSEALPDIL